MPTRSLVAGIDLGGTHMQIGIVDEQGNIIARTRDMTEAEAGAERVIERIARQVKAVCAEAEVSPRDLIGIGVGAPGAIDIPRGIVLFAPNLGWDDVHLAERLSAQLDGARVFVDNDVTVAVLGENRLGAGRNARDVFGVWVGTGIGGGLMLENRLYRGSFGTAGEIGRTCILPDAPEGKRLLEENCSRTAVVQRVRDAVRSGAKSSLSKPGAGKADDIKAQQVAEAYLAGDELVAGIVNDAADTLGLAIANHLSVLSIDHVILGGGLTEALGDAYVQRVRSAIARWVFPPEIAERLRVVATTLRDNAGLLGAALLVREELG